MQGNDGINNFWTLFITISGIAGIINIVRAFKRPTWDDMDRKDREIGILKKKIHNYQRIINGPNRKNKLE